MEVLTPNEARTLILAKAGSMIFAVKFIKRTNGAERTMQCRLHVKKGILWTGLNRQEQDQRCNVLTVFDMNKRTEKGQGAYRRINLEAVFWLRLHGTEYTITGQEILA